MLCFSRGAKWLSKGEIFHVWGGKLCLGRIEEEKLWMKNSLLFSLIRVGLSERTKSFLYVVFVILSSGNSVVVEQFFLKHYSLNFSFSFKVLQNVKEEKFKKTCFHQPTRRERKLVYTLQMF